MMLTTMMFIIIMRIMLMRTIMIASMLITIMHSIIVLIMLITSTHVFFHCYAPFSSSTDVGDRIVCALRPTYPVLAPSGMKCSFGGGQ